MKIRFLSWGLTGISLLGFLDATYLTIEHYTNRIPPCSIVHGCEKVLTSQYSTVLGVPVALFGALYYASIFLASVLYHQLKNEQLLRLISWFTCTGFAASLWFLYLQIFILHSFCQFCLLSALTSTLLFLNGLTILFKLKKAPTLPIKP